MFCTECGRELPDDASFCTGCGAPMGADPEEEQGGDAVASSMSGAPTVPMESGAVTAQADDGATTVFAGIGDDDATGSIDAAGDDGSTMVFEAVGDDGATAVFGTVGDDGSTAAFTAGPTATQPVDDAPTGPIPQAVGAVTPAYAPAPQGDGGGDGPNRTAIIIAIIAAVAAVIITLILVWTFVFADEGDTSVEAVDSGVVVVEGSSSSSSVSSTSSASAAVTAPQGDLSLNNPSDYHKINLYLSNFTELGNTMKSYDRSNVHADQLFNFAFWHTYFNNPKAIESGTDYPEIDGGPTGKRVSLDTLYRYDDLFLKQRFKPDSLTNPLRKALIGGYYYFYMGSASYPYGIALANDLEYLGNQQYRVKFDIYGKQGQDYTVTNTDLYSMTPQQAMGFFGISKPIGSGTAVIEAGYDDEKAPFDLVSCSFS